jgi:hypothetical protein
MKWQDIPVGKTRQWLGCLKRDVFVDLDDAYVSLRDDVADAAYIGDFGSVIEATSYSRHWGEDWVNSCRLGMCCSSRSGQPV